MTYRVLAALLALALSVPTYAACTWSSTGDYSAKNVCADGDEVAPTAITEGIALTRGRIRGLVVVAEADASQTITSGTLKAYLWDGVVAAWARAPELDLTVSEAGSRRYSWSGFTVVVPSGRIAWVPSTVTLSSGGITLYLTIAD